MFVSHEDSPYGITDNIIETLVSLFPENFLFDGVQEVSFVEKNFDGVAVVRSSEKHILPIVESVEDAEEVIDLSSMYKGRRRMFDDSRKPSNAFSVEPATVNTFKDSVYRYSDKLQERFTSNYLPNLMSFDHASAALEAFMRDGLSYDDFSVDDELRLHTAALIKLDSVYRMAVEIKLPKNVRDRYLKQLTDVLQTEVQSKIRSGKQKTINEMLRAKRYENSLDNPVGVVRGGRINGNNSKEAKAQEFRTRY